MKRYIVIEHYLKGTYTTDSLTKEDLIKVKRGDIKIILDTITASYYDAEKNEWKEIAHE